jgi:hypothetical protein
MFSFPALQYGILVKTSTLVLSFLLIHTVLNQSVFCAPPAYCVDDNIAVSGSEDVPSTAESHSQADVPVPAKWGVKSCKFSKLRIELDLMIALESI